MHTCPPPLDVLEKWLTEYNTVNGRYGHILLEQQDDYDQSVVEALLPYFESAHLDAREYFHAQIGINLHPDAEEEAGNLVYPNCLPSATRHGLFGEVPAGLVTESYKMVEGHEWMIPIFLFRYHADVEAYMYHLSRNSKRTGNSFNG